VAGSRIVLLYIGFARASFSRDSGLAGATRRLGRPAGGLRYALVDAYRTLIGSGVDRLVSTPARFPAPGARVRGQPRLERVLQRSLQVPALAARGLASWRERADRRVPAAIGVALVGALGLALLSLAVTHETRPRGDDLIYERMASDPLGAHTFPFAYRIGVPWLVHVLPFAHTVSFELLAWGAAGGAAGFAYLLMRRLGASGQVAGVLALLLALSPPMLVVGLREGRNVDAATALFMIAATLFVVERRLRPLAATLALGVLVREAELFVIPLAYALWATRWWDPRAARRAALVGAPAVAIYVALHLAIPSVGIARVPGYSGPLLAARLDILQTGAHNLLLETRRMFSIYGPLWIAAPLALRSMAFARRGLVLIAASLLSMTFALDWGRMVFLAAPLIYPAAAFTLSRHPRWRIPAYAAFALLILGYAIYMDRGGTRAGILESPPPPYPVR
jgi:hypothetical protein